MLFLFFILILFNIANLLVMLTIYKDIKHYYYCLEFMIDNIRVNVKYLDDNNFDYDFDLQKGVIMKVKDLVVKTQTSSKGKEYTALFAILENDEEVIVCFVNKNKLEKQLTNYFFILY